MTIPMPAAAADPLRFPPIARLFDKHGYAEVTLADRDAWLARPGRTLIVFLEDPARYRESLDLAVIVPEIVRAFPGRFAVGVALPDAARALAVRYGFRRWPALVMLADGRYVGAVDGLRDWGEYVDAVGDLLDAAPTRPPTIGVAVAGDDAGGCHA